MSSTPEGPQAPPEALLHPETAAAKPAPAPSKVRATLSKIAKTTGKWIKRAVLVSAVGTAAASYKVYDHLKETRTPVSETINESGEKIYTHRDPHTTIILNYLAGRGTLPYQLRVHMLAKSLLTEDWSNSLPPNFAQMTIPQMVEVLSKLPSRIRFGMGLPEAEAEMRKTIEIYFEEQFPEKREDLPETSYATIWEMEKAVGSPKVQFTYGMGSFNFTENKPDDEVMRARYIPWDNVVNISGDERALSTLVAEYSHADQFNNHTGETLRKIPDMIQRMYDKLGKGKTLSEQKRIAITGDGFEEAYREEYTTPGSIEHGAHDESVGIETGLTKVFEAKAIPLVDVTGKKNRKKRLEEQKLEAEAKKKLEDAGAVAAKKRKVR